jgi:hypothetical protein
MLMIPKINAPVDAIVRYEPDEFPSTGFRNAAEDNFSYMPVIPPISGLMKYITTTKKGQHSTL